MSIRSQGGRDGERSHAKPIMNGMSPKNGHGSFAYDGILINADELALLFNFFTICVNRHYGPSSSVTLFSVVLLDLARSPDLHSP